MRPIRVLVVDDAVVVRRVFSTALGDDPAFEVVGTAANGKIALAKLPQLAPDVITLDVEMPEMDGLATLAAIRQSHPQLPVVMVSALTERGAAVTIEALALGASDYLQKPSRMSGGDETVQYLREHLVPKLKALGRRAVAGPAIAPTPVAPPAPQPALPPGTRVDVVAIGVSTGGPNALAAVLAAVPADLSVPVLIVQHMPKLFTRFLAERLAARCPLPVTEAADGDVVAPGHVWVAPGDFHLTVAREAGQVRLRTNQDPPENFCRPAVDVLFRSVADVFGRHVLAFVLTGMGQDGVVGCRRIREAGGQIVVQDEATSVVWGMPGYVSREGLAHAVMPLDRIAGEIERRVRAGAGVPRRTVPGAAMVDGRCP